MLRALLPCRAARLMAGSRLLMLLGDVAVVLDHVALITTMVAKQTAGVLGVDLVLNAQRVFCRVV